MLMSFQYSEASIPLLADVASDDLRGKLLKATPPPFHTLVDAHFVATTTPNFRPRDYELLNNNYSGLHL